MKLIGPFSQLISMNHLPLKGKIADDEMEIIPNAGIIVDEKNIIEIGDFENLASRFPNVTIEQILGDHVVMPAFIDCHTHLCFAGDRSQDFALRNAGKSYLEIAQNGGGIWKSVSHTRNASKENLEELSLNRINNHINQGIATIEIKSGYGLDLENELKMLRCINALKHKTNASIIPTCLAAHIVPKDFVGNATDYLNWIISDLLPDIMKENLSNRIDIFIEKTAFPIEESRNFLLKVKEIGFEICVHADQFTSGSARLACELNAKSADHLEATTEEDILAFTHSETVAVALPGASLGLGEKFTPARKLLDAGACLAIATDYNPGSAPMGNLISQASILATFQKLSTAEVFAAITFRAAHALSLKDRGRLQKGMKADFVVFPTNNYQHILYHQGQLFPNELYIDGQAQNINHL